MKKKTIMIAIIILFVFSVAIGISYAYWILNLNQDSKNIVSTKCLNITFTEGDAINLQKTYPMDDEEGSKLTPYTFTLKNECNDKANYQINLETLAESTLDINYVKVKLNDEISILGNNDAVTKTLDNATDSRMLETGILNANETKTFNLNVWLSYNAPNETMNKTFESKITVTTSYHATLGTELIKDLVAGADSSSKDVYTVPDKTSDSCTYTLAYDGTSDNNLRYVGSNPCNYVTFNGEKAGWRIIGILNTPEGQRMKLIRTNSLGNYSWDNKAEGTGSSTSVYGSNDWTDSTLKEVLNNGAYYNKTSGTCPSGQNGATTTCDFTSNGLTETAKNQIDTITWNLGGTANYQSSSNGLASNWYSYERGTTVYTGRPTEWQGKVGLMYPSDYGYATSGGTSMNRASCLARELYNWSDASDCINNDWLNNSRDSEWTISPRALSEDASHVFDVGDNGYFFSYSAANVGLVRPSVYLIPSTAILGGEGTLENPYEIG